MPKDPREELHDRLAQHRLRTGRVEVIWNASDGGPRMTVTLKDHKGAQIDQWEDWMIMGEDEPGRRGTDVIERIVRMVFGERAIARREDGFFHRYFTLR